MDPEIADPGPQLVVPITNARFALTLLMPVGAAFMMFYGTDAMGKLPPAGGYDRGHGARVVARSRVFLTKTSQFRAQATRMCAAIMHEGNSVTITPLAQPENLWAKGNAKAPDSVLLKNNGLRSVDL